MEVVRSLRLPVACLIISLGSIASAQTILQGARSHSVVRSENFIISSADAALSNEVARAAEQQRRDLAMHWLGSPLPNWSHPCPITVVAGPRLGAGGSTTYSMSQGAVGGWRMNVQGTRERILDSVLPHEITHTILASHFARLGKPVPRWADEGACTTVEHQSERSKHDHFLVEFLGQGRALPFTTMLTLREYPQDIMPLYAQGYSVTSFLIAQNGPQRFVKFLEDGMRSEDWVGATEKHYGYPRIGKLQTAWNRWVLDGGGQTERHTALALGMARNSTTIAAADASRVAVASATAAPSMAGPSSESSYYKDQLLRNAKATTDNLASGVQVTPAPNTTEIPSVQDYSVGHQQPVERLGGNPVPLLHFDSPYSRLIR